jgi:hypothetical protein
LVISRLARGSALLSGSWALRSLFDPFDGIDRLTDQLSNVSASIEKLDADRLGAALGLR